MLCVGMCVVCVGICVGVYGDVCWCVWGYVFRIE